MSREFHIPVLVSEVLEGLITNRDGIYVDATVGGGGHAAAILSRLSESGRLIGIDRDAEAIRVAGETLRGFGDRVILRQGVFRGLKDLLAEQGRVDGALFDLGVSSHQIDEPTRGFSYSQDGPLDMRMGESDLSAYEIVNSAPYEHLLRIFREFGEDLRAAPIAKAICEHRNQAPIRRTGQLGAVIRSAIPPKQPQKTLARIFQAIRIEVNGEIENLPAALRQAVDLTGLGGGLAGISYHSGEDRTVKGTLRELGRGWIWPSDFPVCKCGRLPTMKLIQGRRGIRPTPEEVARNPRARSATLRIAERI